MLEELRKLVKHATIYGAGNALNKIVGFLMIPLYTRFLSPTDYGMLELLNLTLMFVSLTLTIGINASVVRFYYDYEGEKDKRELISTALISAAFVAGILAASGALCARGLAKLILKNPDFASFVWLISASFFLSSIYAVCWSYLRAKQRSVLIIALDLTSLLLLLSMNIYFVAIVKTGVIGILYSSLISNAVMTTLVVTIVLCEVKISFNLHKIKALAVFGSPLVFTSFGAFAVNFSDRFFLQHYSSLANVGLYSLGYKFGFMLSFLVVQPFNMIWGAQMYEIAKRNDGREILARIFHYYTLMLTLVALGISVPIKEIIMLIAAPSFWDAYRIVPIVGLAYVFQGFQQYFVTGIYIKKATVYVGILGAASAAINLLLNFLLIPHYQAMGAAVATVFTFFPVSILGYVFSQRLHPIPYRLPQAGLCIGAGIALFFASNLIHTSSVALTMLCKSSLILALPFSLYLIGFFDRADVARLRQETHALIARAG